MISAFGVEHTEISKVLMYYRKPTLSAVKQAAVEMAKAPKRPVRGQLKRAPELDRKDYIAPDGVQVRWRGGGVAKSFVPGKGYTAATKLSDVERHIVRNKALGNSAMYRAKGGRMKQAEKAQPHLKTDRTQIYPEHKTTKGKIVRIGPPQLTNKDLGLPDTHQGFSKPNGRGGGDVFVLNNAADRHATYRHEMAHIKPKRNIVNFQSRRQDPVRSGREEGRADFTAHGKPTTGQYPGGDDFQRGYNEVQGKMAAAKWRKDNR